MTKTIGIIGGICVAIAVIACVIPAVKGPYNRIKNNLNEQLDNEFVVDNYKAQYIDLHAKREDVVKNLQHFVVEQKIAEKKLVYATEKKLAVKNALISAGTSDMRKFNQLKDQYEILDTEVKNIMTMMNTYSNAIVKLETTLGVIETNMSKAKTNVATLESKKMLVDSISAVNKTVENLNSTGDSELAINVEKLDDKAIRESIKLEALNDTQTTTLDKQSAETYLQNLK